MQDVKECLRGLPKKIKIGPYDWVVVIKEGPNANCGSAVFQHLELRLWPANIKNPALVVGVVLHECLHVIYDFHALDKLPKQTSRDDVEEKVITAFEGGLVSLFRDNPKMMVWMKKWLK
jgi:hypothetical protein